MDFINEMKRRIMKDGVFDIAAQMAYYFLLSFFPFLLLTFTLFAYLPVKTTDILNMIRPFAPSDTYGMIKTNLVHILDHPQGGLLSISLLTTFYIASLAFRSVIRSINDAYEIQQNRPVWKEFLLGFVTMFGLLLALLVSLLLPVFGSWIETHILKMFGLGEIFQVSWFWIRWLLTSLLLFVLFLFVYLWGPNIPLRIKQAVPGAIFATFGWQISSLGFAYYVSFQPYTTIYGNLGTMMILLGWFYLSALVLILGAQINAIISGHKITHDP
ncbi:YihY/virulence factor BrkB family protein [Seinonella peptonophila]|uniref:YihY/virulence factor BrkB family protein n=1 Tax=Seinonella peptonophila TaxID=112248 RepID=UPI001587A296|nr:YihY/virulence factor BrkB family protein [Seinonella peptonophila]